MIKIYVQLPAQIFNLDLKKQNMIFFSIMDSTLQIFTTQLLLILVLHFLK